MDFPKGEYSIIYADPPWSYRQCGTTPKSRGNAAKSCKKTYPFSTYACPYWVSREGMFRVSGAEEEGKKPEGS